MNTDDGVTKLRIYLPPSENGINSDEYINQYIENEFPMPTCGKFALYVIPRSFRNSTNQNQATFAEYQVYEKFKNLTPIDNTWIIVFHGISYGGRSYRNQRFGKLIIREHDFVVFVKNKEKFFLALIEVKSSTTNQNLDKVSDSKILKNNKRSAQHQLRDHLEVISGILTSNSINSIQTYIMWPFLTPFYKNNQNEAVKRWIDDKNLHVFNTTFDSQANFDLWFCKNILSGCEISKQAFQSLLHRYILLSCGVFVDEIDKNLIALLNQEQLDLLNSDICQNSKALVVHGAAGTGKTLLILKKLEWLYQNGRLDGNNRALYICYWPGLRYDFELKLEALKIKDYVDTARFFISMEDFLHGNENSYRHIFMDEAEAICLALDGKIMRQTFATIYRKYHDGNCTNGCVLEDDFIIHEGSNQWGELWFMVDINQASMFLPKHSPNLLKIPSIILTKVMRSTVYIFEIFKQFYNLPMPLLPKKILDTMHIPKIHIGHNIYGPPVYWVDTKNDICHTLAKLIIDLCTTKGFYPKDLCVIPFFVKKHLDIEKINQVISEYFIDNCFRPIAIKDVEYFLKNREINQFLIAWALRVKGLEFKIVVIVIDNDEFDFQDGEDRKKAYIMASRCTSMLLVVCREEIRRELSAKIQTYPFGSNV